MSYGHKEMAIGGTEGMSEDERLLRETYQSMAVIMTENRRGNTSVVQQVAHDIYMKAVQRLDKLAQEKAYRN
jgi:hypothetical protein